MDQLTRQARVFARVEPRQKLDIVESLQRNGHFVAVSGDGANDAPALRAAQVGVAMGKSGTDVARETSDLVISSDLLEPNYCPRESVCQISVHVCHVWKALSPALIPT